MKIKIFISLLIISISIFSQKKVLVIDKIKSDKYLSSLNTVINTENNNIFLVASSLKSSHVYLINENFNVISEFKVKHKIKKYRTLGYKIDNNNYKFLLSKKKNTHFAVLNYSFNEKTSSLSDFNFNLNNEKLIKSLNIDNHLFLLTVTKETSLLNIYEFDKNFKFNKSIIDFSKEKFINKSNNIVNLDELFITYGKKLYIINNNYPNSTNITSEKIKIYINQNTLLLTFDNNNSITQLIEINLETKINKKFDIKKTELSHSNSYLYKNYFLQFATSKNEIELKILDFKTKKTIKEIHLNKNDSISFINDFNKNDKKINKRYRKENGTKKFIKDLSEYYLGVSIFEDQNNFQISLGSKIEAWSNSGFGTMNHYLTENPNIKNNINPLNFNYNIYSKIVNTQINCLFDSNFNHIKTPLQLNIFDKVKSDFKKVRFSDKQMIFEYNGSLYTIMSLLDKRQLIFAKY